MIDIANVIVGSGIILLDIVAMVQRKPRLLLLVSAISLVMLLFLITIKG